MDQVSYKIRDDTYDVVEECTNPVNGHWVCVTDQVHIRNNISAEEHFDKEHLVLWLCFDHDPPVLEKS